MLKVRSIGLALGITASLVALGIALGVIVTRVNQSAASTLTLSSSAVLSSADLAIWEDDRKTKRVTSLKFEGVLVQPPPQIPWYAQSYSFHPKPVHLRRPVPYKAVPKSGHLLRNSGGHHGQHSVQP